MAKNKKCMVFETLGNVKNLQIQESQASDGLMRMTGVFGVCGIKNGNNRVYDKANYGKMVEALQKTIMTEGCPGELEHPNSMNIDLNNISHKIESIEMNEDGTITGTIVLLNTDKGKNAQAIVEGGLPLYISSRALGSIDESGHVTLSQLKTYDLVGTPGFAQAKLTLKPNQSFESLNESLEDGNIAYAIVLEGDEKDDETKAPAEPEKDPKDAEKQGEGDKPEKPEDENDKKDTNKKVTMEELKKSLDALSERITNLEADLHVAQEALNAKDAEIANLKTLVEAIKPTDYDAIQQWMTEEFAPEFKGEVLEAAQDATEAYLTETFAPTVDKYLTEEFAPTIEGWLTEEFAPTIEGWITEEFGEEMKGNMQQWVNEEFAPMVQNWLMEEYTPEQKETIMNEVNSNVSAFLESQKADRFENIDKMLESLSAAAEQGKDNALQMLKEQQNKDDKFAGCYAVQNMPNEYRPSWEMLSEARKEEIARSSRMYDFTKAGVMESFWAGINFNEKAISESAAAQTPAQPTFQSNVAAAMMALRH